MGMMSPDVFTVGARSTLGLGDDVLGRHVFGASIGFVSGLSCAAGTDRGWTRGRDGSGGRG